jgi:cellulose synthase/poly-beta-1,6-N-acetylglucosamine synthase-like glycosyltransferase
MKTEEILRYESEFKTMQKVLKTSLLVFEFPKANSLIRGEAGQGQEPFGLGEKHVAEDLEVSNGT